VSSIREIAHAAHSPRVSTIFDLTAPNADFKGWNSARSAKAIIDSLPIIKKNDGATERELTWSEAPKYSFQERLWLTGAWSDNVAASTCLSDIGLPYMKAVERAWGLYDPRIGMHLFLADGYALVSTSTPVTTDPGAKTYRDLSTGHREQHWVTDVNGSFGHNATQPGSAAALTAYMIALVQGRLVSQDACDSILTFLSDTSKYATESFIVDGVKARTAVPIARTKIGILGTLLCEFAYLETGTLTFAVIATGIRPRTIGGKRVPSEVLGRALGTAVFDLM
jgi:hypothetical protein